MSDIYSSYDPTSKPDYDTYLRNIFGDELESFLHHGPLSEFVRVNTLRATLPQVEQALARYGFETERVAGLDDALRLISCPFDPTMTLHHFAGWFVKQSLSSQLPVRFLDIRPGQTVLDMCAAPGSKTTQIATAMHNTGRLYANDLAGKRMTPLAARLDANIVTNTVLLNLAAERLTQVFSTMFDRILADVPCTGLGNLETLEENRARYEHAKNPASMNQLQYRIALTACKLLKTGGRMVYSTCSLDPAENECVLNEIVTRMPFRLVDVPDIAGVKWRRGLPEYSGVRFHPDMHKARRVTPWENDTQGFFFAVLEKTDDMPMRFAHDDPETPQRNTLSHDDPTVAPILENIHGYYGIDPEVFRNYRFFMQSRGIYCLDAHWETVAEGYHRAGLCLAKKRGGMWRLSHAMIQALNAEIKKNIIDLSADLMREIARTGEIDAPTPPESPYPVIRYGELGCIATTYDLQNGRIRWKRSCCLNCL